MGVREGDEVKEGVEEEGKLGKAGAETGRAGVGVGEPDARGVDHGLELRECRVGTGWEADGANVVVGFRFWFGGVGEGEGASEGRDHGWSFSWKFSLVWFGLVWVDDRLCLEFEGDV